MNQISDCVAIVSGGEPVPTGFEDSLKIALMGSSDMNPNQQGNWQSKFAQGLAEITCTEPGKGIIMYRGMKFLLLNCRSWGSRIQSTSYDNPAFVQKLSMDLDYADAADCIFYNFLKKSEALTPLMEFGLIAQSGKVVCRCPDEYSQYGFVRVLCERYNIPLLPGATTGVLSVLQTLFAYCPKFQEISKFRLPE